MSSGYSGTPLAKKLGIKANTTVVVVNAPVQYQTWLGELPVGVSLRHQLRGNSISFIHFFVQTLSELSRRLPTLNEKLDLHGSLWISWPKHSSNLQSDLNRDLIRNHVLASGLVDTKICAVSEDWSALKFVYRTADRN